MTPQEQKYYNMARIAKKQNASIVTTTEMLIRVGCEYNRSMDIVIEVWYEDDQKETP